MSIFRGIRLQDVVVASVYVIVGTVLSLILLGVILLTASYTQVEFPTGNDGMYGFLMKSVQTRVPLAKAGGGTVTAPAYNPQYATFGVSSGAPINPTAHYTSSKPFSTSAWWSRLVCQKSPTAYTVAMPYAYCGTFNLYRSKNVPSFAITIARPYSLQGVSIPASNVCGQTSTTARSRSLSLCDGAPTCFTAPMLWDSVNSRPYNFATEMTYSAQEVGNMTAEMLYNAVGAVQSLRIGLSQITPYVVFYLSAGASMTLNQFYRDGNPGAYFVIKLLNPLASGPPPYTINAATHLVLTTEIIPHPFLGGLPPIGESQTSIVKFEVSFSNPVTVRQLADYTIIVTTTVTTTITVLPTSYYVANPRDATLPQYWVNIGSDVSGKIFGATPVRSLQAFVSATSRNGQAVMTYTSDSGQPIFFVPSLAMTSVGKISGADPASSLPAPFGTNYWLSPQGPTAIYIATTGRFDVSFPLFEPPRFGMFDIYSAFDANSLKRLNTIFYRDLQALYAVDVANDSFYVSVRKIFTFAQMTYAVFNFPANSLVNIFLPPLRTHLMQSLDQLLATDRAAVQLGFNPQLFLVATGDQQYGSSQNQVFGDNHVGQYGMLLYIYYIVVSIQYDNTARRYARDKYQSIMVDLMRDFAQPYVTDQYIPSMRHFDYGSCISSQTSSIIEASSLQVSEVTNGYYACWLVASLFGDSKLRDYYRAILSIEMATHQEYRLAPLAPQSHTPIYQMVRQSAELFNNCTMTESGLLNPIFYSTYGTTVYLIQGSEIVLHSLRNDHPDYKYLVENVNPNTVTDFSSTTFYRPMTPLSIGIVPLTLGINLNSHLTVVFTTMAESVGFGASSEVSLGFDALTGLTTQLYSLENNPSVFMTIQGAYSLSDYARQYVTNYTWAGANLPPNTCAVIPAGDLPTFLSPIIQYNRLGISDSNTVFWIQYVITAYGPRK
jgi:hypothetical protein